MFHLHVRVCSGIDQRHNRPRRCPIAGVGVGPSKTEQKPKPDTTSPRLTSSLKLCFALQV
ncbi:hypothetical protein M431DRAFT_362278 [Trichoderma harzianum CBS 226.95]|uniref:Uncharacterized protein n=1 Tax=Trichoderma harzianum CBS 226.95 TaxID=983964 RepID=A0A2T4AMJ8_TRIHA|nr:hypothetical protein M431DRAFT_362278 [Trichoderma harzianum CBS 226.95]PTB58294.1 hypothetical protein M431DRAFT_362278 [Trichoderma harzianum CBS 226.95]